MRHTRRFLPLMGWAYLWWVPVSAGIAAILLRLFWGTWPEVGLGYVLGWLVGGFIFGLLLWLSRNFDIHVRP